QVSVGGFIGEHKPIALETNVQQIGLFKHLQIDFAELEFCVEWRRRGLDWCGLLLRARDGSKGRAGYAEAKCKSDQICLLVGEHSGQFPEPGRGWHRGLTIQEGSSDVN